MTTAHFLLLRASEFTVTDPSASTDTLLYIRDVSLNITPTGEEYLTLTVGVVLYTGYAKHAVCAVCAMKSHLCLQKKRPDYQWSGPLFRLPSRCSLSCQCLMNFVSPLLRLTGLDPHQYSGHSLRIEGATSASVAGLNDHEIKLLGRWSSDCYKRYIRSLLSFFLKVPQQIADTGHTSYQYANPYLPLP